MLTLKMKKTAVTVTFILISGRSGEPLTSSNAASNHVDVRPTSQRRAVSPAALFSAAPTAADDDNFLDFFSHDDIFLHQQFRSLIYNNDDRALHDLSADSTMTSPLLCDKPAYQSADWSCYATSFSPSSNYMPSRDTTALATRLFRCRLTKPAKTMRAIGSWKGSTLKGS